MARRIGVCGMSVSAAGRLGARRAAAAAWPGRRREPRPQSAGAGRRAVRGRGGRSGRSGPSPRWWPGRCPSRGPSCARSGSRRGGPGRRGRRGAGDAGGGGGAAGAPGGGGRGGGRGTRGGRGRGCAVPRAASMSASVSPSVTSTAMGAPISPASPGGEHDPADDPGLLRAVLDDRLLGLDLGERVADGDGVAGGDQPGGDGRLRRAREHARHPHDRRHQPALPKPARTRSRPATTSSVRAIAARSSTLEMLGLASAPVTRCTGWSSQSKKRRWISSASQPP